MSLKDIKKREREEMSPIRYKMNHLILPAFCAIFVGLCVAIALVGSFADNEWWCLLPAGLAVLMLIAIVAVSAIVVKKEEQIELARWSYLFKKDLVFAGDILETNDPETGIEYALSEKGLKAILPIQGEQVFDEVQENELFLPWTDVELAVASDNFARRVRLAFVVINVAERSVDGNYFPTEGDMHFLPVDEEMVAFFQKYGLDKKLSVEWRYMQIQPLDAFRQILARGYIRTLIDEKGKRIKREDADQLYL